MKNKNIFKLFLIPIFASITILLAAIFAKNITVQKSMSAIDYTTWICTCYGVDGSNGEISRSGFDNQEACATDCMMLGGTSVSFDPPSSTTIPVTDIYLDEDRTITLEIGETINFSGYVVFVPSDATNKNVLWSSSNTSVATVSSSGVVTGISSGAATITVRSEDGGHTDSLRVEVAPVLVESIDLTLSQSDSVIDVGDTINLSRKVTILPLDATDKRVTWSSSNDSVATVSSSGIVTGVAVGTAKITATTVEGGYYDSVTITVGSSTPVQSISIKLPNSNTTVSQLTITVDEAIGLDYTILPSDATDKRVTWSSSNTSVATVSSDGIVSGKSVGTAVVTVTTADGNKTASATITVVEKPNSSDPEPVTPSPSNKQANCYCDNSEMGIYGIENIYSLDECRQSCEAKGGTVKEFVIHVEGVECSTDRRTIMVGDSIGLSSYCYVVPESAEDDSLVWSSSDTSIATVDANGVVTGRSVGNVRITATTIDGDKPNSVIVSNSVVIQVIGSSGNNGSPSNSGGSPSSDPGSSTNKVIGIVVNPAIWTLGIGDTKALNAVITPTSATNKNVTWSSSDTSIATVDTNGVVTGVAVGTVTITATTVDGNKTATSTIKVVDPNTTPIVNENQYVIATEAYYGNIDPSIVVTEGSNITIKYSPYEGYELSEIKINGEKISTKGVETEYTFKNISKDYVIAVTYAPKGNNPKTGLFEVGGVLLIALAIGGTIYFVIKKKQISNI